MELVKRMGLFLEAEATSKAPNIFKNFYENVLLDWVFYVIAILVVWISLKFWAKNKIGMIVVTIIGGMVLYAVLKDLTILSNFIDSLLKVIFGKK